jgi:signal transduction histidine kinase/ActR/RegA family two-component response regulator/HAMP domain-containing protein
MEWFRNLPIRRKMTLVIMATCITALMLACAALGTRQYYDLRESLVRDATVLADVVGANTQGALLFEDETTASEILRALHSEPYLVRARIYKRDNQPFADYIRAGFKDEPIDLYTSEGHRFRADRLQIVRPIFLRERRIGSLYLELELSGIYQRERWFTAVAVFVLAGSLLVALLLSKRLQRPISEPILALAETAKIVAESKDYTIRAPSQGQNELGQLTQAFNQMLSVIAERDTELHTTNSTLREEVSERKLAQSKVQSQLARLAQLHQITRAIGERQSVNSIFLAVARSLEEELPIDFGSVCLYDHLSHELTLTSLGPRAQALSSRLDINPGTRITIDQGGLLKCIGGQVVYEPEIDAIEVPFLQRLAKAGMHSLVMAPLIVESHVFGVLIAARVKSQSFSSGECEFLRQLSEHVALAAHQAQLHGALQQAYDDLRQTQQTVLQQERLSALGQMASGIAHDINNAISPIGLYAESLLEHEQNLSGSARNALEIIQRAVDDVAQTVSRMREFYRQRESNLLLNPVALNQMVIQATDLTRVRWSDMPQSNGIVISLHQDLSADLPFIMGVESEVREALTNLILNAVDAMPSGGLLTLRTRKIVMQKSRTGSNPSAQVHLEVVDTGIGMDEETRRRCLEPFYTTKGERGTGLGLAMVYGSVQRHRGEIEIESTPGKGTTFRLVFPVSESFSLTSSVNEESSRPQRLKLLIVDDDPMLIKSLRDSLESEGHQVTAATGGQNGIDTFLAAQTNTDPYELVITDLGMPYVDGRRVSAAVKAASPMTPVILLTGWGQRIITEGETHPNVDRVLSKPPRLKELRSALYELSQRSRV